MKKFAILSLVALLASSCNAQERKKPELAQNNDKLLKEEPQGSWEVHKEVDENGNIIQYDSIYSWSSDNLENLNKKDMDSIMGNFSSIFEERYGNFGRERLPGFFQRDSLFMKEYFGEDFLNDDFGKSFSNIDEIYKQMEALKQRFLQRDPLIPAEPENEDSNNK